MGERLIFPLLLERADMRFPLILFAFVCCAAIPITLVAQSPHGNMNGLVSDPSGAAVSGADVVAANDSTRVQHETRTNGEGIYVLPDLPPGLYRIQVSKIGFKTIIKPDIVINVQDAIAINFTLPLGASHEIVTVEGGAPLVNTESAAVSTVIDRQFAENLPMNGRSFQTLIELTPGVVNATSTPFDSGQFNVNGQRAVSNYWMVDGVSANFGVGVATVSNIGGGNGLGGTLGSFSALGGTNSLVSVDALQEFRIQTSTFAPEFGRTPGGQISIVTRSGTNAFHGSAFDYLRNDTFDANNWFNTYVTPPLAKAKERQNDFGGVLGGPIVPDKTFFFFSYEGLRLRLPQTTLSYVPDLNSRRSPQAVPGIQPYLDAFPLPAANEHDVAPGVAPLNASFSNPANLDAISLRLDDKVRDKWSFFGRYNYSPSRIIDRGGSGAFDALSVVEPASITTETGTVGATWAAANNVANDIRANFSEANSRSSFYLDGFDGAVPLAHLPFPEGYNSDNGFFQFFITTLAEGRGLQDGLQGHILQRQINLVDNLSVVRGSHALRFGADFRRLTPSNAPAPYWQRPDFDDVVSADTGVANGSVVANNSVQLLFRNLGVFAQDTWRARPRLTLTYGIRWDVDFAPSSLQGPSIPAVTGYDLQNLSTLSIAHPGTPPYRTTYNNFAPRIGLAFQAIQRQNWQTMLRGGFGIFYDLVSSEIGNSIGYAPPFQSYLSLHEQSFPWTSAQTEPPAIPDVGTLSDISAFNPDLRLPYTLEWNVSSEQSLGAAQAFSVSYVGASGRRLLQNTGFVLPPSNPAIEVANLVDNTSFSSYNALQLQFQRRLSGGLQAVAGYTWSHSIDNASAGSAGNTSNFNDPGDSRANRGSSDFDIRNASTIGLIYEIPVSPSNSVANAILRGWSTENFVMARSAVPVDILDSEFFEFNSGTQIAVRPDLIPGEPLYLYGGVYPGNRAINPAAFSNPPFDPNTFNPTRQGDLPRNFLRAFGAFQWDLAVHRDFPLGEILKLQFRAEAFNLLNHPNFGPPNNQFGTIGFGLSQETLNQSLSAGSLGAGGFDPLYQIGGPRSLQLALKLTF